MKQRAAEAALEYLRDGAVVGVGTGSTVNFFIDGLAAVRRPHRGCGLEFRGQHPPAGGARHPGAGPERRRRARGVRRRRRRGDPRPAPDQGRRRRAHPREDRRRGLAPLRLHRRREEAGRAARRVPAAGRGDPDGAHLRRARNCAQLGGEPVWREGFVTDNGNHILDVRNLAIADPVALEGEINQLAGVVTVGLFARRPADVLLVGTPSGVVTLARDA